MVWMTIALTLWRQEPLLIRPVTKENVMNESAPWLFFFVTWTVISFFCNKQQHSSFLKGLSMTKNVLVLPGDGIGQKCGHSGSRPWMQWTHSSLLNIVHEVRLVGGSAYDETGSPLPEHFGYSQNGGCYFTSVAVGGPKWDNLDHVGFRPEKGLLAINVS